VCDVATYVRGLPAADMVRPWGTSLISTADNACTSWTAGRITPAYNQLQALDHEAQAQSGAKLSTRAAATLHAVITFLTGSSS
jgi:hypothetical protein